MTRTEKVAQIAAENAETIANHPGFKRAVAEVIWCHHNNDPKGEAISTQYMNDLFIKLMREII